MQLDSVPPIVVPEVVPLAVPVVVPVELDPVAAVPALPPPPQPLPIHFSVLRVLPLTQPSGSFSGADS